MMRTMAPLVLLIVGFLLMSGSFVYYASNGLPYPDPTAELLAHQAAEAKKWGLLFALGLLCTAIGGASLWRRLRARRVAHDE